MANNQPQGKRPPAAGKKVQARPKTKDEAVQHMAQQDPEKMAQMLRQFLRQREGK